MLVFSFVNDNQDFHDEDLQSFYKWINLILNHDLFVIHQDGFAEKAEITVFVHLESYQFRNLSQQR